MKTASLTLLATLWIVCVPLAAGVPAAGADDLAPPPVDARAVGLAGVGGIDGGTFEPLFRSPGILGGARFDRFGFQRTDGDDPDGRTWDRIGIVDAGQRFSYGLGFVEGRADPGEPGLLDRRVAAGIGMSLTRSGRFGLGATGSYAALGSGAGTVFGYGAGFGIIVHPQLTEERRWSVAPSVQTRFGSRFDSLPEGQRTTWNVVSAYSRDDLGLTGVVDIGDGGPLGHRWALGLEGDLGRVLRREVGWGPVQRLRGRLGLNEDGLAVGVGADMAELQMDVAIGHGPQGACASWSLTHRWGADRVVQRLVEAEIAGEMDELIVTCRGLIERGEFASAAERLRHEIGRTARDDVRGLAEYAESLILKSRRAETIYAGSKNFREARDLFAELAAAAPQTPRFTEHREIAAALAEAERMIGKGLTKERVAGKLREVIARDPEHVWARRMILSYDRESIAIEIDAETVFLSAYKHYRQFPAGRVRVTNNQPFAVDSLTVTIELQKVNGEALVFEDLAFAANESKDLDLRWRIDDNGWRSRLGEYEIEVIVDYGQDSATAPYREVATIKVMDRQYIDWKRPYQLHSFVTTTVSEVAEIVEMLDAVPPDEFRVRFPDATPVLYGAAKVHGLLQSLRIGYSADPRSALRNTTHASDERHEPDQIRYPAQILHGAQNPEGVTGDCDDLTVLWVTLLEAMGFDTAPVLMPQHVMLLVDTGVPANRWQRLGLDEDVLWFHEGRTWLPIEATAIEANSLYDVCRQGKRVLNRQRRSDLRVVSLEDASRFYEQTDLTTGTRMLLKPDIVFAAVKASAAGLMAGGVAVAADSTAVPAAAEPVASGLPPCSERLSQAEDLLVRRLWAEARMLLESMDGCGGRTAAVNNNLGYVALQEKRYADAVALLTEAHGADPADAGIELNLRLASFLMHAGADSAAAAGALADLRETFKRSGVRRGLEALGGVVPTQKERQDRAGPAGDNAAYDVTGAILDRGDLDAGGLAAVLQDAAALSGDMPAYISSGPRPDASPDESVVQRRRYAESGFPSEVALGEVAELAVRIMPGFTVDADGNLQSAAIPGGDGGLLDIDPALPVLVVVRESSQFRCLDDGPHFVAVPPRSASETLRLRVRAAEAGRGTIDLDFWQDYEHLGGVTVEATVAEAPDPALAAIRKHVAQLSRSSAAPDLTLVIQGRTCGPNPELVFRAASPLPSLDCSVDKILATRRYDADLREWLAGQVVEIQRQRENAGPFNPDDMGTHMEAFGRQIAGFMPAPVRELLESADAARTILILTDDPFIPWEMAYLDGPAEGRNGFFCADRAVTRGVLASEKPSDIRVDRAAIIEAVGVEGMHDVDVEPRYIMGELKTRGVALLESRPTNREVFGLFSAGGNGIYHFATHGRFAPGGDLSRIPLSGGDLQAMYLDCPDFASLERDRPLVFLNACESGRADCSPTGPAGWSHGFIDAGAAAFVAPVWRVTPSAADEFAREFYAALAAGRTLGEAALEARRKLVAVDTEFNWLAYAVYGHPHARLLLPGAAVR